MRPLHKLLFGFPLVMFFKICLCLRSSATVVLGFRRYFLILVALIQWVSGLAGRRASRTLPPSRYYGRWLLGRTGLAFQPTPSAAFEPIHSGIYRWQRGARRRSGSRQSLCCGPNPLWTKGGPDSPCAIIINCTVI